jgi:hypothetical protein
MRLKERLTKQAAEHIREQINDLSLRLGVPVADIEAEIVSQSLACPRGIQGHVYALELFEKMGPAITEAMKNADAL